MSRPTAISIGNFDGVHCGHRQLIVEARRAVGPGGEVVALTFDPHPMQLLAPEKAPKVISTFAQRQERLQEVGADRVVRLEPTPSLLDQSPASFLEFIKLKYRPRVIVEGPDFRFGRDRAGDVQTLREEGGRLGIDVRIIDPVEQALSNHEIVQASSTLVRWLLKRGRVRDAAILLERSFAVRGRVIEGAKRGRDLGFPTANLKIGQDCLLPADGVYAGRARIQDGRQFLAAISVGTNPTFDETTRTCEAHILDFNQASDTYDWSIEIAFESWIREQIRYAEIHALIDQLHRDVKRTRELAGVSIAIP